MQRLWIVELKQGNHSHPWEPWSFHCTYEKALETALRENLASDKKKPNHSWKYRIVSYLRETVFK